MSKGTITAISTNTIQSKAEDFPNILHHIPDPPARLYVQSNRWRELQGHPWVAIVGSRKPTAYGRSVTAQLAAALAQAGVVIVSGLAIGIDGVAHRAALDAGGLTVAILAGGLDAIYPGRHQDLAKTILQQGGALVSEYPDGTRHYPQHFIARNRLVSGLSQAIAITEAAEKSGTLHTARFGLEQGKDVFAVPGNITSPLSIATNRLIKSGAYPLTSSRDILQHLGLEAAPRSRPQGATPAEQALLDLLYAGESVGSILLAKSGLAVSAFNQALTMLEITGKIRALGADRWSIVEYQPRPTDVMGNIG